MKFLPVIVLIGFVFPVSRLTCQTKGCTDPLAINYNTSATINDASCIYNPGTAEPLVSYILSETISETSGLIVWNDQLWTHNDNIDTDIYSLDTVNGKITQIYSLAGIKNRDWEEISQDEDYIYLGDFGNNAGNRKDLKIYKIDKNSLLNRSPVADSIGFSYSDQVNFTPGLNNTDFDCEAFVVSEDSIYLFTKQWISNRTSVYSLPKIPGNHIAKLNSSFDVNGLVTGAFYMESKRIIVLSGYSKNLDPFLYLLYDFSSHDFFSGNKRKISVLLPFHQTEGITSADGIKYYITNENFSPNPFISIHQKLLIFDLSPFLGSYLNIQVPHPDSKNNFIISPVPAHDFIKIRSYVDILPADYYLINLSGQIVLTGRIDAEFTTISISGLAPGLYILKIGEENKNSFKVIKE
jgi:hypothetical protein